MLRTCSLLIFASAAAAQTTTQYTYTKYNLQTFPGVVPGGFRGTSNGYAVRGIDNAGELLIEASFEYEQGFSLDAYYLRRTDGTYWEIGYPSNIIPPIEALSPNGSIFGETEEYNSGTGYSAWGYNDSSTLVGRFHSGQGFYVKPRESDAPVYFQAPGASYTAVTGINNGGEIVGFTYEDGCFIRHVDGTFLDYFNVPNSDGLKSSCYGINGAGEITGSVARGSSYYVSVRREDGTYSPIMLPPGASYAQLGGVNDNGIVGGSYEDFSVGVIGFIATPGGLVAPNLPPAVAVTGFVGDSSSQLQITATGESSPLQSIEVTKSLNCTVVANVVPGTITPVIVTVTLIDPLQSYAVGLRVTDMNGNVANFNDSFTTSLKFSSTSFHFAPHPAGETGGPANIYIVNTLSVPLGLNFGLQDGRYFATTGNTCGASLASGASCQVFFTFSPPGAGNFTDSLLVQYNAAGSPQPINLSGSGLGSGLTVSPSNFSFAGHPVGETSGPGKIFLHNFGSDPLAILSATIGGAAASDFQIVSTTCSASLAPYETCSYTLTTTLSATGLRNATLTIASSWSGSPQTVTLQTFGR